MNWSYMFRASDETLCDIYNHIDDLKALGRSEDFVDVEDIQFVNLEQDEESYRRLLFCVFEL